MKKMSLKKSHRNLLALGALVALGLMAKGALPALAQGHGVYAQAAGKIADEAAAGARGLQLTDVQKAQLKALFQKYAPQVRAVITGKGLAPEDKKAKLLELRTAARAEADGIFTPDQQAKAQAARAEVETDVRALVGKIADELDLTSDQAEAIRSALQDARFTAAAIVTDETASRPQKRSALKALREKTRGEVMAILTPEQQSKLEAILSEIRPVLVQKAMKWKESGGLGLMG